MASVNFGDSVIIRGSDSGASSFVVRAGGVKETDFGGWVCTLQSEHLSVGTGDDVPLLADVRCGAGGMQLRYEVDAYPGATLNVPASSVEVKVFWDPQNTQPKPDEIRVRGILQRGLVRTVATRTFEVVVGQYYVVPPYARTFDMVCKDHRDWFRAWNTLEFYADPSTLTVRLTMEQVYRAKLRGESLRIPPKSIAFIVNSGSVFSNDVYLSCNLEL